MDNDLISRSALIEILRQRERGASFLRDSLRPGIARAILDVYDAPTVDAKPVRYGMWGAEIVTGYDGLHPVWERPCLLCGKYSRYASAFCPHCGAKMNESGGEGKMHR